MIRNFLIAAIVAFFSVSTFLSSPLSAIAADYSQSQSARQQESQSYPSQAAYKQSQDATDYRSTDKQTNQTEPQKNQQEKQSNQTDGGEKQYAQRSQSYPKQ